MDIFRAWTFSALVYLGVNALLTVVLPPSLGDLFLICPFLAGAVGAGIHLWKGRGGWLRHGVAVLGAPIVLALYYVVVVQMPAAAGAGAMVWSVVITALAACLGAVVAHVFRTLIAGSEKTH